ncbi:MAG: hypothetical protein FWG79_09250 [Bacteroidales bacterium]|nr:hypothetical protein [Bacteroidales bacterium]
MSNRENNKPRSTTTTNPTTTNQNKTSPPQSPPNGFIADPYQRNVFYKHDTLGNISIIRRFECGDSCTNRTMMSCENCSNVQHPIPIKLARRRSGHV